MQEDYGLREFCRAVADDIDHRCGKCYGLRLEQTARYAALHGFDSFSSTLFVSPYQNHELLRQTAEEMARRYGRLPSGAAGGAGAGAVHAEILRLRVQRGGALRQADRPRHADPRKAPVTRRNRRPPPSCLVGAGVPDVPSRRGQRPRRPIS